MQKAPGLGEKEVLRKTIMAEIKRGEIT